MARAGLALLVANVRYWSTVAPRVHEQLSRWERRAREIPDPALQALALGKLRRERFNVEVAATLATLARRPYRRRAVEAIVALQVMYDYLDALTEQPLPDQLADGRRLSAALVEALAPELEPDGREGYLEELAGTVRRAFAQLPTARVVAATAQRSAGRCAEAQVRSHAAARAKVGRGDSATAELERWARREAAGTTLQWPQYLAGAGASVISVHALIAAAADPGTTAAEAEAIDTVYLSIGALTMLDSVVDREEDIETGELGFLRCYESAEQMARELAALAAHAAARARSLAHAPHHIMTLVGVVAYYTSAPTARSSVARPIAVHLRRELQPLIAPTLALMRTWRLAKSLRWRATGTRNVSSD